MKQNVRVRISWHSTTDTYLYPDKWREAMSRNTTWRACVHIAGDYKTVESLTINGVTLVLDWNCGLAKWSRLNVVDVIEYDMDGIMLWLPKLVEPDGALTTVEIVNNGISLMTEVFCSDVSDAKLEVNPLLSSVEWVMDSPCLVVTTVDQLCVNWVFQLDGVWNKQVIYESATPGPHTVPLQIPFADTVQLEVLSLGKSTSTRHRYAVVGKAGVVSGRHVWYRGTLYSPKITRPLPWVSVIVPVLHPDDIERVPSFVRWNQSEWWIQHASWSDDAIDVIREKFPSAKIVRLGPLGDNRADVQVLRPIEVQPDNLQKNQRYAIMIFDNAGDLEFARRAGWSIDRLMRPDLDEYRFVERTWRQGLVPQNATDGLPQHGFSFSFVRPPEHEHLWRAAQRDLDIREHKESLQCNECEHKASCRQSLPIPYASPEQRRAPWISLEQGDCPLPRWFARKTERQAPESLQVFGKVTPR